MNWNALQNGSGDSPEGKCLGKFVTAYLKVAWNAALMSHVMLLIACKVKFFQMISKCLSSGLYVTILCLKLLKVLECVYINGTLL